MKLGRGDKKKGKGKKQKKQKKQQKKGRGGKQKGEKVHGRIEPRKEKGRGKKTTIFGIIVCLDQG